MNENKTGAPNSAGIVEDEEMSLLDLLLAMKAGWRVLVFTPLILGLIALAGAFAATPIFTASTQLMTPQQQQSAAASLLGSLGGALGGAIPGVKSQSDQWLGLLKSRTIADALVERFHLRKLYDVDYQFQARDHLANVTRVTAGKDGLIRVEVDDPDPKLAAQMANAYVEQLQVLSKTLAVSEAAQRRVFFESQLLQAKDSLIQAQIALNEAGISPSALRTSPEASVGEIGTLKARVAAQEVRLAVMRGYLTASSPDYLQAVRELNSLKEQMAKAAQDDPGAGKGSGSEYVTRFRDFKYAETMFDLLARQFELAKVDEAKDGVLVQVVDPAEVPEWKSRPKRGLIAVIAAFAGLVAAGLFVSTRRSYRRNNNSETLQKLALLLGRRPFGKQ